MVHIVVLGSGPEGKEVSQGPGKIVSGVRVDGLEQAQHDPEVHREQVQVLGDEHPEDGGPDGAEAEEHDLDRGGVFSSHAEGRGVVVVHLMYGLVQGRPVGAAMHPVVPGIFEDEEDHDLVGHLPRGREGHAIVEAAPGCDGVEEPDLGEFDGEVAEEDEGAAFELLLPCGDFLLWV